jgi:glycosyltransferase involved in cell wall biosynthesis
MKILLAITTYNQLNYTKKLVNTLKTLTIPGLDIVFIDDVSKDGTQDFIKKCGYTLIERNEPKGLTWSWNIAYRKQSIQIQTAYKLKIKNYVEKILKPSM